MLVADLRLLVRNLVAVLFDNTQSLLQSVDDKARSDSSRNTGFSVTFHARSVAGVKCTQHHRI